MQKYMTILHKLNLQTIADLSQYITDMTGITNEALATENDLNVVFGDLYAWCYNQEPNITNWHFYSYGDGDVDFIKHSLCNIKGEQQLIIASLMIATMTDFSEKTRKYFCGTVSLIKAFNYLQNLDNKQKHNALEDAKMLAEVFTKIYDKQPLNVFPFERDENFKPAYTFPSGRFFCKANKKEREFADIHDAIHFLIESNVKKEDREKVHRDRMACRIMKAIRKKEKYMGYNWRREK